MRLPFKIAFSLAASAVVLMGSTACSGHKSRSDNKNAQERRVSEFDYYCSLRPQSSGGSLPFAIAVSEDMKAHGYKAYMVTYSWRRGAPIRFGDSKAVVAGYGMRNFFDAPTPVTATLPTGREIARAYGTRNFLMDVSKDGPERVTVRETVSGTRSVVVWETGKGEFFLVDHYYASPRWLAGSDWQQRIRFYDPGAGAVVSVR